jgi:hypothetical protein
MASTANARATLKYLASCALNQQTTLTASSEGTDYEFPGGIGLAPDWVTRPMTEPEQRWVSACMLARTNFFGVTVQISMRSQFPSEYSGLMVSLEEAKNFPMYEATFFGNLFADKPVSFVCGPQHSEAAQALFQSLQRVCALPKSQINTRTVTACGMIHLGECTPAIFEQDGTEFREAISVYLSLQ